MPRHWPGQNLVHRAVHSIPQRAKWIGARSLREHYSQKEEKNAVSFPSVIEPAPQKLQQDRTNIEKHRWHFQRFLFCTAHQVQQVVTSSNKVSATLIRLIKNAHLGQGFWKRQEQPQGGVAHWDAMNVTWSVLIWAIVSLPFIAFYSYIM